MERHKGREVLVTAQEMRRYDRNTIEHIGMPAAVLMERAALAAFAMIVRLNAQLPSTHILIMAGMGNNGGDGLALARLLAEAGYRVSLWCVGDVDHASDQWKQQREILSHYSVSFVSKIEKTEYTILVDALFGVGLSRNLQGEYAEAVEDFNRCLGVKLALDIPSGVCADTGQILGTAVKADYTVTFGFCKRGLRMYPGSDYAGEVEVCEIGIGTESLLGEEPEMFTYHGRVKSLLPIRSSYGNKGTFGKVLLVAGDIRMAGAAVLSGRAAGHSGAGMVKIQTHSENRIILQQAVSEALLGEWRDLEADIPWADVIAIGPGLGKSEGAWKCLNTVVEAEQLPIVLDADALNLLAADEEGKVRSRLSRQGQNGRSIIMTPHVGELARMLKISIEELKKDLPGYALHLAKEYHAVVVAKDARTFVCAEGKPVYMNCSGNNGMACAGSGDVLTGIIAGLLAQGMEPYEAAVTGCYWHGRAGDLGAEALGEHALTAGGIIEHLGMASWQ